MQADHLWSCSSINITPACCIATIGFEETSQKQARNIQPMTIGKVIYRLIAHTLAIQFKDTFTK
jgi:hypothetical protein